MEADRVLVRRGHQAGPALHPGEGAERAAVKQRVRAALQPVPRREDLFRRQLLGAHHGQAFGHCWLVSGGFYIEDDDVSHSSF